MEGLSRKRLSPGASSLMLKQLLKDAVREAEGSGL